MVCTGVSTDSRGAQRGNLFVALKGDNFDGHEFLDAVAASGAGAALVEKRGAAPGDLPLIFVKNTRAALLQLASAYRREHRLPVVAVAGSNGKTSTKDILSSILGTRWKTLASQGSFNNDVGVPITLLGLDSSHEAAVVEVGTNHPGELAPLLQCVQPQTGVITNIGREHLEHFGGLEGVALEEGSLAEALPVDGALFIGGDGEWAGKVATRAMCRVVRLGTEAGLDWRLGPVRLGLDGTSFSVEAPQAGLSGEWKVSLIGRLGREEIQRGLLAVKAPKMRLQPLQSGPFTIFVDCYNANADSTIAALDTLSALPAPGRKVAVLGDMGELGETARDAHEEVGRAVAGAGVQLLVTAGALSRFTGEAARVGGLANVVQFDDVEHACAGIPALLRDGDWVLVKASRSARMERVVQSIEAAGAGKG